MYEKALNWYISGEFFFCSRESATVFNKYYSRTSVIAVTAETQISFDIITIDLAEKVDK